MQVAPSQYIHIPHPLTAIFRSHLFRPRPVIPGQQIHASTLSGDLYAPWATLAGGVCIPTTPLEALDKLWIDQPPDDRATTRMLTLLLRDQQTALKYLNNVLFLLHSSTFHPLSTHQCHKSDASKLSRAKRWPDPTKTAVVGGRHSEAIRF